MATCTQLTENNYMFSSQKLRMNSLQLLIKPQDLMIECPATQALLDIVHRSRADIIDILTGRSPRLLIIIGPCSIHDVDAALEYATRLKKISDQVKGPLHIVMRTYFEKPRTTLGWKGFISDPFLDGSFQMTEGVRLARQLLLAIHQIGMTTATEFLDTITPHYLSDLISWSVIGARTVESQAHRELASALPMPVGFKNNSDGNIQVAIDAIQVAGSSHPMLSMTEQGLPAMVITPGNPHCHVVLRGGHQEPNYAWERIQHTTDALKKNGCTPRAMVDCNHGNSRKNYLKQIEVVRYLIPILKQSHLVLGIMLESNLMAGKQEHHPGKSLTYGQSITDACLGWEETEDLLLELAESHQAAIKTFA